ncbi:MAG: ribonuclease D [Deltaproteobacteria bacterium]|nr:ribonuclease D [Deltaproteobacteria bacterium]
MGRGTGGPQWIDTDRDLDAIVDVLAGVPAYGFDTEFHRERSYYPHLALVQLSWEQGVAVVDPLAVDLAPLRKVLEGKGLGVCHSAEQDLEVLQHACGAVPARLFDTQIAAAFSGLGFASLAKLVAAIAGERLPKGDRLTDWTRRPLDENQIAYAASDVQFLLPIAAELRTRAEEAGTLAWIEEECERVRTRPIGPAEPETAWWRIKGSRSLRGASRGIAQEVAAWRERSAAKRDLPPRFVLPDLALAAIVQRGPHNREELARVRGLDGRYLKGPLEREILSAVARGRELPAESLHLPARGEAPLEEIGPTVALGLALVAQVAEERGIEPSMLASRADVHAVSSGRTSGKLASGWRDQLVGEKLRALLSGRSALTGDGRGGVRLIGCDADGSRPAAGVDGAEVARGAKSRASVRAAARAADAAEDA